MNTCHVALTGSGAVTAWKWGPHHGTPAGVAVVVDRRASPTLLPEKTEPLPPRQQHQKLGFFFAINIFDEKPRESLKHPDCEMRDHGKRQKRFLDYFRISIPKSHEKLLSENARASKRSFLHDTRLETHSGITLLLYCHYYYNHNVILYKWIVWNMRMALHVWI